MLPLKYLFENYELAKECLKRYDHSERYLDEMLKHFRISSNAIYPFYANDKAKICYLRLSPIAEKSPSEVSSEIRFILWLLEHGFPIMKPYPMKNGKLNDVISTQWGTYNVSCFEEVSSSKWGSCSGKGNLNFNCLLMLTPPEVIDSVVVHELCHRKEMNHSDKFYEEVLKVFPDYWTWDKWLKDNGDLLMKRMTK